MKRKFLKRFAATAADMASEATHAATASDLASLSSAFRAHRASNFNVPHSTNVTVLFDTEFDTVFAGHKLGGAP